MEVSVLILTYNRKDKLRNLLTALSDQSYKQFEVIVLVNDSKDGTVEFLNKSLNNYPFPITPIYSNVNLGRSGGRNALAAQAKGELLVFLDDDLRPLSQCISIHKAHHSKFANSILVGATPEDPTLLATDLHHYKSFLSKKWEGTLIEKSLEITEDNLFLAAANMSISKSTFRGLNGFNEILSDAEDLELGHRAIKAGVKIYYSSEAIAWHDDFITARSYVVRQRQYQEAQRKIGSIQGIKTTSPTKASLLKQLLYYLFSRKFFIEMMDHSKLFLAIPKNARYKLYSLIIWGLATTYKHREV